MALRTALTRAAVPLAAALVTLAATLAAPVQSHGGDTTPGRLGAVALVCDRSFDLRSIDAFELAARRNRLPYYLTRSRTGAVVSSFGPAPSVMAAPGMRSLRPGIAVGDRALLRRARYGSAVAVSLAAALVALGLLAELGALASFALALAAGLSFAGAATLGQAPWQQTAALPWLAGALAALAWSRHRGAWAVPVLALAAVGVLVRPPAVALFAALAAAAGITLGRDLRRWAVALVLAALASAPLIAWNLTHHGVPIGGGQSAANAVIAGAAGPWTLAPWTIAWRLVALLVSPARGVVWFAPLVLVAVAAAWRGDDRTRRLVAYGAFAHALIMAAFFRWYGGQCFGPRLLSECVWVAPWLVATAAPRWHRVRTVAAVCTVLVGCVAVARLDPRRWELQHDLDARPGEMWAVVDSPLVALVTRDAVGDPVGDGPAGPFLYCAPRSLMPMPRVRAIGLATTPR